MTGFDAAVIAILLISGFLALIRGFVNEVFSILAWIIAALAAVWMYPLLTPVFRVILSLEWLSAGVSAVVIFAVVYTVVALAANRISARVHEFHDHVGVLDRTLGFIFGIARGLVVVAIAYTIFTFLTPRDDHPEWITASKTLPLVEATRTAVLALVPRQEEPVFEPKVNGSSAGKSDTDTGEGTGYKSSERRSLDQLFESTTGE